jgi:glycosyltransferase involved in cell wall biosynthesis
VETNIDRRLTADPNDRGAWIQAMVRLLRDEEWARQMKEKIRRFAEQTSWERVGKLHGDLYQDLTGGS